MFTEVRFLQKVRVALQVSEELPILAIQYCARTIVPSMSGDSLRVGMVPLWGPTGEEGFPSQDAIDNVASQMILGNCFVELIVKNLMLFQSPFQLGNV